MSPFLLPPKVRCSDGEMRRVGFELEYSGPELETSARIVAEITAGEIREINPWHYVVGPIPWGDFTLTLDFQLLIRSGLQEWLHNAGFDEAMEQDEIDAIEYFIGSFSASLVPFELTTPPLPLKTVTLEHGTNLHDIIGQSTLRVNALHHQAVDRPGERFRVAARDGNNIV
ncbi:MAG: amidoligase family protein [Campylobacterales bacterium]|nr:amidoligase family protein [Campylobacterales bacterium]